MVFTGMMPATPRPGCAASAHHGSFSLENYCLGIDAHEAPMHAAGLRDIR
jgi:hypothetical protein